MLSRHSGGTKDMGEQNIFDPLHQELMVRRLDLLDWVKDDNFLLLFILNRDLS